MNIEVISDSRSDEPIRGVYSMDFVSALQEAAQEFVGVSVSIIANPGEEYEPHLGHKFILAENKTYIQIDGVCDDKKGLSPLYKRAEEMLTERK